VPTSPVGLLFFLAALTPGYLFVRIAERRSLRPSRSNLVEAVELAVTGALASLTAAAVVLGIGRTLNLPIVSLPRLIENGKAYLVEFPERTLFSGLVVLALANALAALCAWLATGRHQTKYHLGSTVFIKTLAPRPDGRTIWAYLDLDDDCRIDGRIEYIPTSGSDRQDVALIAPIAVTTPDGLTRSRSIVDAMVVPGDRIKRISLRYVDTPAPRTS
jgi:hypothetical protein